MSARAYSSFQKENAVDATKVDENPPVAGMNALYARLKHRHAQYLCTGGEKRRNLRPRLLQESPSEKLSRG